MTIILGAVSSVMTSSGKIVKLETAECNSLEECSKEVRKYIVRKNIGGSEFEGGTVLDENGKKIARISYNGRIWLPGSDYFNSNVEEVF